MSDLNHHDQDKPSSPGSSTGANKGSQDPLAAADTAADADADAGQYAAQEPAGKLRPTSDMDKTDFTDTFFIAVGSSAGGIEALSSMLSGIDPATPHCFFILQHLSPHFATNLPDILSRVANMPVQIPKHEQAIKPGAIYLMPPGKIMTIFRDRIILAERAIGAAKDSYPIDIFIESLAAEKGQKAIAVILSGAGSDGSRHLEDIANYNGYVIAQSEDSAGFASMPKRAIQSKQVHAILAPEEILGHIDTYTSRTLSAVTSDLNSSAPRQPEAIERIFFFLNTKYSLDFSCYQEDLVISKIDKRLKIAGAANYGAYADQLATDLDELESLWDELLASSSDTFTYSDKLAKITEEVFPRLVDFHVNTSHRVKIWVIGCHTGEEAYMYAFLLEDYLEKHDLEVDYQIFATDAHSKSVAIASRGVFPQLKISRLPARIQKKYFITKDGESTVRSLIREKIVFAKHNVVSDVPFPRTHLVSCRSLFHNLKDKYRAKVLQSISFSLNSGGLLVLSHGDSIKNYHHAFSRLDLGSQVFVNESSTATSRKGAISSPNAHHPPKGIQASKLAELQPPSSAYDQFESALYQELCHKHSVDGLVFDSNFEVSFFFGNVSSFLTPISGRANHNLETLIPHEIFHTIATWCNTIGLGHHAQSFKHSYLRQNKAKQTPNGSGGSKNSLGQSQGGSSNSNSGAGGSSAPLAQMIEVTLTVLDSSFEDGTYFFCSFAPQMQPINSTMLNSQILDTLNGEIDALKSQLEYFRKELLLSKDQASATVGELEASNEQLMTTNDQLQSTNEELQSTNEELQAVNEELHLINAEHQNRIADLSEASNEMAQLCDIADIATLYLDKHLSIRKYNRQCRNLLNLLPEDNSRSITHFSSLGSNLPESVEKVLHSKVPLQKRMAIGNPSKLYDIKLYPHRNIESRLIGVMVVFLPVDMESVSAKDFEATGGSWQSV